MKRFFLQGYAAQVLSVLLLFLSAILLPNFLGPGRYAFLSVWIGLVTLPAGFLSEALSFRAADILKYGRSHQTTLKLLALTVSAVIIGLVSFAVFMTTPLAPLLSGPEVLIAVGAIVAMCVYVTSVAWLRGGLHGAPVLWLSALNGALNIAVQMLFARLGLGLQWVPLSIYVVSVGVALALVAETHAEHFAQSWATSGARWGGFLDPGVLPRMLPALLRYLLIWLPIFWLNGHSGAAAVSSFRIATSLIFAGLAIVPFPRETVFALSVRFDQSADVALLMRELRWTALIAAAFGSLLIYVLADLLTELVFRSEFVELARYLRALCSLMWLACVADTGLQGLFLRKAFVPATVAIAVGGLVLVGSLFLYGVWVAPLVSLGTTATLVTLFGLRHEPVSAYAVPTAVTGCALFLSLLTARALATSAPLFSIGISVALISLSIFSFGGARSAIAGLVRRTLERDMTATFSLASERLREIDNRK